MHTEQSASLESRCSMKKKAVFTILILSFAFLLCFSVWQIARLLLTRAESSRVYADLAGYVQLPSAAAETAELAEDSAPPTESAEAEPEESGTAVLWPQVDFDELAGINSGVVGWIYLEDSQINYPVAQAEDNSYYLKHLFDGSSNSSGCIFLDYRNSADFSDRHSILYGHHMKNGTMFAGLVAYKSQDYYDAHPSLMLLTPEQNYTVELFAGYVASSSDDAWETQFASDEEFQAWLNRAAARSCFTSGVTPEVTDRILTLSTCTYEFDNARFVLLGILRTDGD